MMLSFAWVSCSQDPPIALNSSLTFSGYQWSVKASESLLDPGQNYFSKRASDVYVDAKGALHLKIVKHYDKWYSTEVYTDSSFGYGTFIFYVKGDLSKADPNTVLGLFSWNDTSFHSQVNSEIDVEIAKFGVDSFPNTIQYSVQPTNGNSYKERFSRPTGGFDYSNGSTHAFKWTSTKIEWFSYQGQGTTGKLVYYWSFNTQNPPRRRYIPGDQTNAIVIPQNVPGTGIRINFWSIGNEFGTSQGPSDGIEKEMIINKFEYQPL